MVYNNVSKINFDTLKSRSIVSLNCNQCHTIFDRTVKYIKYKLTQGQTNFCCSDSCAKKLRSISVQENNTSTCTFCESVFVKKSPTQTLCSKTCSNKSRKHSDTTKEKISKSLCIHNSKITSTAGRVKIKNGKVSVKRDDLKNSLYSIVYTCLCHNCKFIGTYKTYHKYCSDCQSSYAQNGRSKFKFNFNVYHYPNLFDLKLLDTVGWKSRRGDKSNPNGLTRDHKVSVKDAIKHNYDPYYISHPMNCELMRMSDNQKKSSSSSITYEELVKLVDEFDSKYGTNDGTRTRDK